MRSQFLGREGALEEGMAIHCSILAWRLPWTEEPGGPKSIHMVTKSQTRLSNKQTQHPSSAKQLRKTCIIKLTCLCFFKKKKKERKQYSGEQ